MSKLNLSMHQWHYKIKINCLNKELLVNKNKKIFWKGINKNLTETIGKIIMSIEIDKRKFEIEFNLVKKVYPYTRRR